MNRMLILSLVTLAACSDDTTTNNPVDASVDVTIDRVVTDAPADVTPVDSGQDTGLKTVPCGNATCQSQRAGNFVVEACCTAKTNCGFILPPTAAGQCVEKNQPGALDTSCPTRQVGATTFKGCCKPTGTCGLHEENQFGLGLGCFAYGDFGLPPPDGGVPTCGDGGAGDAGDAGDASDARDAGPG
jgi:hypothetical protein